MPIDPLIQRFAKLPGLGPRSARRLVLHLLQHREQKLNPLAEALKDAAAAIRVCGECGNLDGTDPCQLCTDPKRDMHTLCVVEEVSDLWAIERSHAFRGRYHVLGGTLSAIDGRGPDALRLNLLLERIERHGIAEMILATNATVDGQTTAHYITGLAAPFGVRITRLAQGIPIGGELDYLDDGTLGTALRARQPV